MELLIGDIHGCWEELQELLARAGLAEGDRILALGDVVDRGPESRRVFEYFRTTPNARSLMGNHERKHISSSEGRCRAAPSQVIVRHQFGADYVEFLQAVRSWPLHATVDGVLAVHGFFEPGVLLASQRDTVICGTLSGEHYLERKLGRPWYATYSGPPLVVGHHDYLRTGEPLVHRDLVYGIDTGCCVGGRLTGLLLPAFRFVSVPARRDYWSEAKRLYADVIAKGLANDA